MNYSQYIGPIFLIAVVILFLYCILKSPFNYPYFSYTFDVSGKRAPKIDDYIDKYFINGHFQSIENHQQIIEQWKKTCLDSIEHSLLKSLRMSQYNDALNDSCAYRFILTRDQTRYKQINYVRTPYKVKTAVQQRSYSYSSLQKRYNELKEIDFECTLNEYHNKNQRRLMTKDLRKKIMLRDNYTCQKCGKYMPDEVGLQIDHIIPVSRGGKTVATNLQVLCSKCNGKKSNLT